MRTSGSWKVHPRPGGPRRWQPPPPSVPASSSRRGPSLRPSIGPTDPRHCIGRETSFSIQPGNRLEQHLHGDPPLADTTGVARRAFARTQTQPLAAAAAAAAAANKRHPTPPRHTPLRAPPHHCDSASPATGASIPTDTPEKYWRTVRRPALTSETAL